jgi:hypothetical protein
MLPVGGLERLARSEQDLNEADALKMPSPAAEEDYNVLQGARRALIRPSTSTGE